ncbi:UNVERIFIED_CONTAM: hypothetical protein NCL1_21270 [Trichonephila clavipes]
MLNFLKIFYLDLPTVCDQNNCIIVGSICIDSSLGKIKAFLLMILRIKSLPSFTRSVSCPWSFIYMIKFKLTLEILLKYLFENAIWGLCIVILLNAQCKKKKIAFKIPIFINNGILRAKYIYICIMYFVLMILI